MTLSKHQLLRSLERRFSRRQIIFREGDTSREMYILIQGAIEIYKNEQLIATITEPDSYFGEMSTLLGLPRTATAIAASECRTICIPEDKVTDFFAHSPALGIKLAVMLAKRLHAMNEKYERMLNEVVPEDKESRKVFARLTIDPPSRALLHIYCQSVGKILGKNEVVQAMGVPLSEATRILDNYKMAGLIQYDNVQIKFLESPNLSLRRMLLDWRPV